MYCGSVCCLPRAVLYVYSDLSTCLYNKILFWRNREKVLSQHLFRSSIRSAWWLVVTLHRCPRYSQHSPMQPHLEHFQVVEFLLSLSENVLILSYAIISALFVYVKFWGVKSKIFKLGLSVDRHPRAIGDWIS